MMTLHGHSKLNPCKLLKKVMFYASNRGEAIIHFSSLDFSHITDNLIVCSYPVIDYPKLLYRNSLEDLIRFLNTYYGTNNWKIYNLRVENDSCDYSDSDLISAAQKPIEIVENIISSSTDESSVENLENVQLDNILSRKGWLDHQPPPFLLIQEIIDDIHNFIEFEGNKKVAVIHCKMGIGRSGTICVAYLMKYEKMKMSVALETFHQNRFRYNFLPGVTILSQLRYLKYHECFLAQDLLTQNIVLDLLNNPTIFIINNIHISNGNKLLFNRSISIYLKLQKYNKRRNELIDIDEIDLYKVFLAQSESLKSKTLNERNDVKDNTTPTYPRSVPRNTNLDENLSIIVKETDIRLELLIKPKNYKNMNNVYKQKIAKKLDHLRSLTASFFWLNFACEYMLKGIPINRNDSTFKHEFTTTIEWTDIDGSNGGKSKGIKLFDSISINFKF